ncbi:MAG: formate dehydrogenase subunit gamma [Gammaproteobacteria bacterium]|jgi:formate dehydrogenase subunit gamma|nr:formate dehydrogenase subunit gamma [Gammaproteobacteria bacterium]
MTTRNDRIERYTGSQRTAHWVTAISFLVLTLSGLALFHPAMSWLANLLGGGQWNRILHPFIGVLWLLVFARFALPLMGSNVITGADLKWLARVRRVLAHDASGIPPVGRYNGGQKVLYWVLLLGMLVLLASGVVIWEPYFAEQFTVEQRRIAVLAHALTAWVLILSIIVHVTASIWTAGSLTAMIRGKVSRAWAKHHHPGWYREVTHER